MRCSVFAPVPIVKNTARRKQALSLSHPPVWLARSPRPKQPAFFALFFCARAASGATPALISATHAAVRSPFKQAHMLFSRHAMDADPLFMHQALEEAQAAALAG